MSGTLNFSLPAGNLLRSPSSAADCRRFLRPPSSPSSDQCRSPIRAFAADAVTAVIDSRRTESLYEVLRINQNASLTEIKSAYRSLAKLYHPDSASESDGRDFIEIHNAYETLSDPSARELYDLSLVDSHRRRRSYSSSSIHSDYAGFCSTRRWETDQCW